MGTRYVYTPEQLIKLRNSPQVERPPGLRPEGEWMGTSSDNVRNSRTQSIRPEKEHSERTKLPLLDQTNRRPPLDRHISRGSANPEDIILGPPKTSFASATSMRNANKSSDTSDRPSLTSSESRDRYSFRKGGDGEDDRFRDGRSANLRAKRGEGDQDSDGWSTVKPRKSFGNEGAERFNGRMGGDRHREDRRFRERDDREIKDRPARGFETFSRDRDGDQEQDGATRRNGTGRGRDEPSWFKDRNDAPSTLGDRKSNGDKYADRSRGWREKDREDKPSDRGGERGDDRGDRRWEKERRQERDPEWMDEPADEKKHTHTVEDFQKWKERMKAGSGNTPAEDVLLKSGSNEDGGHASFFNLEKPKVEPPVMVDSGPDKFFGLWAKPSPDAGVEASVGSKKEKLAKTATVGKSSRFTSFFSPPPEEQQQRQTEPPPPPAVPAQYENNAQSSKEKEDFARLLQKLQSQSFPAPSSTPPVSAILQPELQILEKQQGIKLPLHDSFQQYRPERQEPPRSTTRDSQQALQDLLGQRQASVSQPSTRPEQMLQELVNHRQNALSQSSSRTEQAPNRNAEFLMGLMQNARAAPEPLRSEQIMMRMQPQQQVDRALQQMNDREQDIQREQRERITPQRQRRPEIPPGFYEENLFQRGPQPQHEGNPAPRSQAPPQPTQILQRPPPGLDQLPLGWGAPNAQLPPPMSQQRHIAPPPGLPGGPNRGMPMPQNMFPPGFPMGGAVGPYGPGPDGMVGAPRNMPPPPPGFMMPPPGFMGGPPMNAFQGPEMAYGPYDGRGAPQGNFRRQ